MADSLQLGKTSLPRARRSERTFQIEETWENEWYGNQASLLLTAMLVVLAMVCTGVSTRTGSSFDAIGIAWQYRWGGGL